MGRGVWGLGFGILWEGRLSGLWFVRFGCEEGRCVSCSVWVLFWFISPPFSPLPLLFPPHQGDFASSFPSSQRILLFAPQRPVIPLKRPQDDLKRPQKDLQTEGRGKDLDGPRPNDRKKDESRKPSMDGDRRRGKLGNPCSFNEIELVFLWDTTPSGWGGLLRRQGGQ